MSDLAKAIEAMEFSANLIENDMRRQWPRIQVRCLECNKVRFASWSYLRTSWPKCHGKTMRLETL